MITSSNNSKLKNLKLLQQKAKARKEQDVFVTEGVKMFLEAEPDRIKEVYLSESFARKTEYQPYWKNLSVEVVSDEIFAKASDTVTPQGVLCVQKQYHYSLDPILSKKTPLCILLEDIQDPGNLGTILRTAEGAGVDGVILSKGCVDIYNPKTVRATMGSLYRVPFMYTEDLEQTIQTLQQKKVQVYAAHLQGKTYYQNKQFQTGTAFLMGNEGNGLRENTAKLADDYIKIPMEGQLESLNVAVATALLVYEAKRQRS